MVADASWERKGFFRILNLRLLEHLYRKRERGSGAFMTKTTQPISIHLNFMNVLIRPDLPELKKAARLASKPEDDARTDR